MSRQTVSVIVTREEVVHYQFQLNMSSTPVHSFDHHFLVPPS